MTTDLATSNKKLVFLEDVPVRTPAEAVVFVFKINDVARREAFARTRESQAGSVQIFCHSPPLYHPLYPLPIQ
jgi:hypothetical protein